MQITKTETLAEPKGFWRIEAFDAVTGELVQTVEGYNLITTVGKQLILDLLAGINGAAKLTGIATGTSNSAASVGDTTIATPQFKAFESTPTRSGLTTTYTVLYGPSEGNINIQELGMLTTSGGTLFNRIAPIGPFNKTSAVSIRITVQLTQA